MSDGQRDSLQGEELKLAGNNSLTLADADSVWLVMSGSMTLFVTRCEASGNAGSRRHLFTVSSGEAIFGVGVSGEASRTLLAVSLEETDLIKIRLQDLAEDWARQQGEAVKYVSDWAAKIGSVVEGLTSLPIPDPQHPSALPQQLDGLHSEFLRNFAASRRRDNRQRAAGLMAREEQLQSSTSRRAPRPRGDGKIESRKSLCPRAAPRSGGDPCPRPGIGYHGDPPRNLDPHSGGDEALRAIARNSHFRIRKVLLAGKWWTRDCGPILAFKHDDGEPVALLPDRRGGYALLDPGLMAEMKVTPRVAAALQPFGYVAYRPFPEKIHRPHDVILFSLKGARRELGILR